jgi:hypothetical protein
MQREAFLKFVPALGCRAGALGRDECGDLVIVGSKGRVAALGDEWDMLDT